MNKVAAWIYNFIDALGGYVSWLNVAIIVLIVIDVFFRYLFNQTRTWVGELEWQLFALTFLLGMSYGLQNDRHIRVDLSYEKFSEKKKRRVNAIGHILFLIPWCAVVIVTGYKYASNSFYINEGSPNPNGLPFRYLIKSFISIGFVLLALSGIAEVIKGPSGTKSES